MQLSPPTTAPDSLLQAMAASPAYCRALVQRLRSGSSQAEAAAKLPALVSGRRAAVETAAAAGAIPALIQALRRSGSAALLSKAARALTSICLNQPANLRQLWQAGGVDALLPLLAGACDVSQLASDVLDSLARKLPELKQQLGAAALAPLLSCVRTSGSSSPRQSAALVALIDM